MVVVVVRLSNGCGREHRLIVKVDVVRVVLVEMVVGI